jgi:S-adenosylmethionine synthetase|nr:MAG TPA: S adenosylmethionine synthase [Caudoviricetes sp.]
MIRFSEYVSLGHPDKVADYISQYLLDRYIEHDPQTRYAVEVQIKGYQVTLGGEVSSKHRFSQQEIAGFVRAAVNEIGYTREYQQRWGAENTICGDLLNVSVYISQQSPDIAQGLDGWGDQGIFFGYCAFDRSTCGMPYEHTIAKRICKHLFDSGIGGLDIKAQVITDDGEIKKLIVAIPLQEEADEKSVRDYLCGIAKKGCEIIINGTGRYVQHSPIADCGTTGRKLAVDFYGGSCRIGGGSPWTKDGSKADLTLNLVARKLAKQFAEKYGCDVYTSLACCIGKQEVDVSVCDAADNILWEGKEIINPAERRKAFKLDTPIYASMCRWGLFGEFQNDKPWEL